MKSKSYAARAVDEAMDRAGLTFCDPGAESPEADQLCQFTAVRLTEGTISA